MGGHSVVSHAQNLRKSVNEPISLGMVPVRELPYRNNETAECINSNHAMVNSGRVSDARACMDIRFVSHAQNLRKIVNEPISEGMVPASPFKDKSKIAAECVNAKQHQYYV